MNTKWKSMMIKIKQSFKWIQESSTKIQEQTQLYEEGDPLRIVQKTRISPYLLSLEMKQNFLGLWYTNWLANLEN